MMVMYHGSVCRGPMMWQRRPRRAVHGQYCGNPRHCNSSAPIHQRNKFDPLGLYGGLQGLSFDPSNAKELLSAVSALRSTQGRRGLCTSVPAPPDTACPALSFSDSSSPNNSDMNSFTRPSTPPCPATAHAHAHAHEQQPMPRNASGSDSPEGTIPSHPEEFFSREEFLRERVLLEKLLEDTSCSLQQQEISHKSPKQEKHPGLSSQTGVGSKYSNRKDGKPGNRRKELTWIDWRWPRTHVACPFNHQRHLELDDSFIRPERISEKSNCFESLADCCKLLVRQLCAPACCGEREIMASTAVDVKELANSYVFLADMPGLKNTDVKVQVENDNVLRISGERRRDDAVQDGEIKYVRVERSAGKFMRKFNLPANADLDAITAACQDGLLTIIVPKTPPPDIYRPRTFDVNVTSADLGKS